MIVRLEKLSIRDKQVSKINQFSFELKRDEKNALEKVTLKNTSLKAFTPKSVNDILVKQHDKHLKSGCFPSTAQIIGWKMPTIAYESIK